MPGVFETKRYYRVTISGTVMRIAPDLQVNESLDQITTVAEFSLGERPETLPAIGDSVLIELIDVGAGRAYPLFGGSVNIIAVTSQPWNFKVTACDQLEKLRRIRVTSDLDLTGLTDREAWMAIADACDIDYDPDDIQGNEYELGAYVDVKWHADNQTTGAMMIDELDRVFGYKSFTVGNNRVVRIRLDQTPEDGTGLYGTFTRGVDATFAANARTVGDRDQLQNAWVVKGVTDEISKSCTAQVWAKSSDGSGYLASRRVRIPMSEFSSDLIQHEALAVAIVERLMKITNRLPDNFSVTVLNDHNIHIGSKIKIVDHTKGIGTGSGVFTMVRSLVRSGNMMSLELGAGPGGDIGTVTHGTEKVCSGTGTDIDRGGDFTDGDFGYPPLTDGDDTDFDFGDETDEDHGEEEAPTPLSGCTTDAFFAICDDVDTDNCSDGATVTETLSGTTPANFCVEYLGGNRLQPKSFSASGPGHSSQCQVLTPWRELGGSGSAWYHVSGDGTVDWVQTINTDTTATLYLNTEDDPDDQTTGTDATFGTPFLQTVSGVVTFNTAGSTLQIRCPAVEGGVEQFGGPSITIYADPGLTVTPVSGEAQTFGIRLNTDFMGPIFNGAALPNHSYGTGNRNNGGYVHSSPAALGVPIAFTVSFDETRKIGRIV